MQQPQQHAEDGDEHQRATMVARFITPGGTQLVEEEQRSGGGSRDAVVEGKMGRTCRSAPYYMVVASGTDYGVASPAIVVLVGHWLYQLIM